MKYNDSDIAYLKKYIKEKNLDDKFYNKALKELSAGKPIQYIVGEVDFYGYPIKVNDSVLIPRYETELLVDLTIKKAKKLFPNKKIDIIDLGTGSGCIAITLKKELNANVSALDISKKALEVAQYNAKTNNTDITFINDDMAKYQTNRYDIIISNPPYISFNEEIMDIVKNNEPHDALYAEDNGLYFYKRIIENIPYITKDKYLVCFEIGSTQGDAIKNYASANLKDAFITIVKDYANLDRFIFITNIKE